MDFTGTGTLEKIALSTDSIIIVFIIVMVIALLIVGIPLFRAYSKSKQAARESSNQREGQLIAVISANTFANTKLSTVLEQLDKNCNECKAEQVNLYHDMINKQDATLKLMSETHSIIDERLERRQRIISVAEDRRKEG